VRGPSNAISLDGVDAETRSTVFLTFTAFQGDHDMAVRTAKAQWDGNLQQGRGRMSFGSGAFDGAYSFASRFEEGTGTNPEELIAAAHAGCFSMALSAGLAKGGFNPESVRTTARVHLEKQEAGFAITRIELDTEAKVPGIDNAKFQEFAEGAKQGCPVSKALAGAQISLNAKLT
jgi:osmotically inducible protein OsmC